MSPSTWDDRNDRETMAQYAQARGLKTLLAACFSQAIETYHQWRVFAYGPAGVCVQFDKEALLSSVPAMGFSHRLIGYKTPTELHSSYATIDELPFVKGMPYRDEIEYRILYSSETQVANSKSFSINLAVVRAISLSPWLAPALVEATTASIHDIPGCEDIPVTQSPVVSNQFWLKYVAQNSR